MMNAHAGPDAMTPAMDWILTGKGEMYNKEVAPAAEINCTDGVPYYDEKFECGFDELVAPSSENPEYLIKNHYTTNNVKTTIRQKNYSPTFSAPADC